MKLLNQKMDNHTNILLYSKFSPASRKIVEMTEFIPNFNLLCIDNKKTRERITKSTKLNIKEVPCIIRVQHDTGYAESFEGERSFQLIKSYMEQLKPKPPVQSSQPEQTVLRQEQSPQVSQLIPESKPRQDSIQKQQQLINGTSLEDLESDVDKGQTVNTYMHVPKSVEFDIDIENRQRTVKQDRSVKNTETGSIVNRALQMQKEREQESSMTPGPRSYNGGL